MLILHPDALERVRKVARVCRSRLCYSSPLVDPLHHSKSLPLRKRVTTTHLPSSVIALVHGFALHGVCMYVVLELVCLFPACLDP
jgi:hypothetical protein